MKLRTLLELGRVSNLPTVWTNMTAGWLLGGGGAPELAFWLTLLGGSLLYLAGMAMNDACDAGWDKQHKGDRPIVQGLVSRNVVWILTLIYGIGGAAAAIFGGGACPYLVGGLAIAITLYNVLHKHWAGSTWFMGSCRWLLYVVAGSAAADGGMPSTEALIWGGALGLYVVGLTYVARGESTGASLIRWPLALLAAPAICSISFAIYHWKLWALVFTAIFAAWVIRALLILKSGENKARIGKAVGWLLAGMVIIDALAVSAGWPYLALLLVVCCPLLILFQRIVAAT